MHKDVQAVLEGRKKWCAVEGDSIDLMTAMPDQCVDLVFGSPPYENRRTYDELEFDLVGEDWVSWMVTMTQLALRVSKGLVCWVCCGVTEKFHYSGVEHLLFADLKRAGVHCRKPGVYYRTGFGGGGPDYFRPDSEMILVFQNGKAKLPYADPTAAGHPPVAGVGGLGRRRNKKGVRKHRGYSPPDLANPGSVHKETYTAEDVAYLLHHFGLGVGDVSHTLVGGGHMGSRFATKNEAPFTVKLASKYVVTFVPDNGVVLDPFNGSGTTIHAAREAGRRAIGFDLRSSQIDLANRRMAEVTPAMFPPVAIDPCARTKKSLVGMKVELEDVFFKEAADAQA